MGDMKLLYLFSPNGGLKWCFTMAQSGSKITHKQFQEHGLVLNTHINIGFKTWECRNLLEYRSIFHVKEMPSKKYMNKHQ